MDYVLDNIHRILKMDSGKQDRPQPSFLRTATTSTTPQATTTPSTTAKRDVVTSPTATHEGNQEQSGPAECWRLLPICCRPSICYVGEGPVCKPKLQFVNTPHQFHIQ